MSFSSSVRLFFPKFPTSSPIFKSLIPPTFLLSPPKNLVPIKTITIQSIPTRLSPPNSTSPSSSDQNTLQPIEELPKKLQEIVNLFQSVQDPRAKYEQLLFYGKKLQPLEDQFKTNENKVIGCVSQGLAALLVQEAEKGIESSTQIQTPIKELESDSKIENPVENSNIDDGDSKSENPNGVLGSRGQRISEILKRELKPIELEVKDVSYQHAGHAGVRGSNGETHFNLKVVSKEFEGKSMPRHLIKMMKCILEMRHHSQKRKRQITTSHMNNFYFVLEISCSFMLASYTTPCNPDSVESLPYQQKYSPPDLLSNIFHVLTMISIVSMV
ncbi:unnamed protein product [Lactuca saligna]|uniref:Fe-S metabolism associated domain-containing protein n=1 Tax=Lactuca saligna TaxID=75948 RepID=A0AA35ZMH8_LACSI|nr:unnamed protein product [Lactuca saligna]